MEENQTQFAAVTILVNGHGNIKNEREHINEICTSNLASLHALGFTPEDKHIQEYTCPPKI